MKNTIHYLPEYFHNPVHPITIALIGCGGTGSLVAARLARLDYVLRQLGHPGLHVTAFDGDKVEDNNVGRQNFGINDIGQFKASTIIEKINIAFGLSWDAVNEYVVLLQKGNFPRCNITITCVDNVEFRTEIARVQNYGKSPISNADYRSMFYWIDCGNGKDFGQVILSTLNKIKQPEFSKFECVSRLPNVVDIYGDLSRFDTVEDQGIDGCSMAESLEKQDLFINDEIAVHVGKMLQQMLRNLYVTFHGTVVKQSSFQTLGLKVPMPAPKKEKPQKKKKQKA